ncbi:DNA polymerase III subunit gamma/tau [Thermophilibacter sp.]|uniref:DNA polymerase III subunit gamma/tau n=1 Tax=Thermophilibacter sp. TaxID=2847309 RepID=UPI003A8F01E0
MESLYTKYRPQTFEQVVGQSHVVETLKRAVLEGRTSHAYLFCGPRGTGKTTMARILAKALMCEKGPAMLPDGTCEQCRLIAAGEHPDVIELDAASRTGVDNVREEIIGRVDYAPVMGRAKVYIIDEVHMLTPAAFNALLKTLEEPPENVVFVMCTTDPQKILATILSRVQRFDFHAIGNDEMQAHLAYVCSQEGFTYDAAALELVVRHARGGMRDALTSLEQLSVFGAGHIGLEAAQDLLGEASGAVLGKVSRAMAHRDVATLFAEVAELADAGRDLLRFTRELAAHVRDVYVVSVVPSAEDVVAARGEELDALRAEAAAFGSPDRVARVLTVLGDASSEMRTATNQRLVLEIALTRVARPESDLTLEALAERVADLERQVDILAAPGPVRAVAEKPVTPQPAPEPTPTPAPERTPQPRPAAPDATSPIASREASEERSDERRADGGSRVGSGGAGAGRTNGDLQRSWKRVVDGLVKRVPAKGSLLLSSTAVSDDGERLTVSLPKGSHFAAKMLERTDVRATVDPAVAEVFGIRQVIYVESSLASQTISRAERPAAPAPAVPKPAPAPAPDPTPAPQPEPAPWEAPEPDPVPYTDADLTPYADPAEPERVEPAPAAPPVSANPAETTAPGGPAGGFPAATHEVSESRSGERGAGGEAPGGAAPQELSPEFADIAAQLSAAFGSPLSVSVETAASTSDEEAAEELSYEEAPEEDGGYIDEPVDDEDDDTDD